MYSAKKPQGLGLELRGPPVKPDGPSSNLDQDFVFGYQFQPSMGFMPPSPYPILHASPPPRHQSPPILTSWESRSLQDFCANVVQDDMTIPDDLFGDFQLHHLVEDPASALDGFQPNLHDSTASFPPLSVAIEGFNPVFDLAHTLPTSSHDSGYPLNATSTAPDVLAAASALTLKRVESQSDQLDTYLSSDALNLLAGEDANSQHLLHFEPPLAPDKAEPYQASVHGNSEPVYIPDSISAHQHDRIDGPVRFDDYLSQNNVFDSRPSVPYQYGTDDSFKGNFYSPPAKQESITRHVDTILKSIEYLEPEPSSTSTRSPSSMRNECSQSDSVDILGSSTSQSIVNELVDRYKKNSVQNCEAVRPKKRGRGKTKDGYNDDDDDDDDNDKDTNHDDNDDNNHNDKKPSSDVYRVRAKRRKSSSSAALVTASPKEPRKNFTPEEKRVNHAGSEQKRRLGLSQCYTAISNMVPDLRGRKHTKSDQLQLAAQWFENLIAETDELAAQYAALKSR